MAKKKNKSLRKIIVILIIFVTSTIIISTIYYKNYYSNPALLNNETEFKNLGFSVNIPEGMKIYSPESQNSESVIIGKPDSDNMISFYSHPNPNKLIETEWWAENGKNVINMQKNKLIFDNNLDVDNFFISFRRVGNNEFAFAENIMNPSSLGDQYLISNGDKMINIIPGMMNKEDVDKILSSFRLINSNNKLFVISPLTNVWKNYNNSSYGMSFQYPGRLTHLSDKLPKNISDGGSVSDRLKISSSDYEEDLQLYINPRFDGARTEECKYLAIKEGNSIRFTKPKSNLNNSGLSCGEFNSAGIIIDDKNYILLVYKGKENFEKILSSFKFSK